MSNAQLALMLIGAIGAMSTAIGILWRAHTADLKETITIERSRNTKLDSENDNIMDMLREVIKMLETAERDRSLRREGDR